MKRREIPIIKGAVKRQAQCAKHHEGKRLNDHCDNNGPRFECVNSLRHTRTGALTSLTFSQAPSEIQAKSVGEVVLTWNTELESRTVRCGTQIPNAVYPGVIVLIPLEEY